MVSLGDAIPCGKGRDKARERSGKPKKWGTLYGILWTVGGLQNLGYQIIIIWLGGRLPEINRFDLAALTKSVLAIKWDNLPRTPPMSFMFTAPCPMLTFSIPSQFGDPTSHWQRRKQKLAVCSISVCSVPFCCRRKRAHSWSAGVLRMRLLVDKARSRPGGLHLQTD